MFFRLAKPLVFLSDVCNNISYRNKWYAWRESLLFKTRLHHLAQKALQELQISERVISVFFKI